MNAIKTLILVRHAKSSWDAPSLDDFDRPLNNRGRRDAPRMGKWLARQDISPSLIVSSPARRTRETSRELALALTYPADLIQYDDRLYEAGIEDIITVITQIGNDHEQVMLVAHNPAITYTLHQLTDSDVDNVPTCGVAIIDFAVNQWVELFAQSGKLRSYQVPKQLS